LHEITCESIFPWDHDTPDSAEDDGAKNLHDNLKLLRDIQQFSAIRFHILQVSDMTIITSLRQGNATDLDPQKSLDF
jgi:hypothetical protein